MRQNFDRSLREILQHEGGYVNDLGIVGSDTFCYGEKCSRGQNYRKVLSWLYNSKVKNFIAHITHLILGLTTVRLSIVRTQRTPEGYATLITYGTAKAWILTHLCGTGKTAQSVWNATARLTKKVGGLCVKNITDAAVEKSSVKCVSQHSETCVKNAEKHTQNTFMISIIKRPTKNFLPSATVSTTFQSPQLLKKLQNVNCFARIAIG